jgi:phospholipid/cholesterol/gamma-HCH transport system substrate-binding protein
MHRNVIETVLGAVVLVVAVIFIVFAYTHSGVRAVGGYDVIAKFGRIDGLAVGDDVRLGGMKVGSVNSLSLDAEGYAASVTMRLDTSVKLPTDSAVAIHTEGLFGGKYMELQPGGEEGFIEPGGVLSYSQDAIILEEVIEKIVSIAREVGKKCKQCSGD